MKGTSRTEQVKNLEVMCVDKDTTANVFWITSFSTHVIWSENRFYLEYLRFYF